MESRRCLQPVPLPAEGRAIWPELRCRWDKQNRLLLESKPWESRGAEEPENTFSGLLNRTGCGYWQPLPPEAKHQILQPLGLPQRPAVFPEHLGCCWAPKGLTDHNPVPLSPASNQATPGSESQISLLPQFPPSLASESLRPQVLQAARWQLCNQQDLCLWVRGQRPVTNGSVCSLFFLFKETTSGGWKNSDPCTREPAVESTMQKGTAASGTEGH